MVLYLGEPAGRTKRSRWAAANPLTGLADWAAVNYYGGDLKGRSMALKTIGYGILAAALLGAGVTPASAEFFGCNEPRTKVSYSSSSDRQAFSSYARSHHTGSGRVVHERAPRRERSAGLFAPYHSRYDRR
jgi:hypothetical protein